MKEYWIYEGCWKRVTPERYLAYDGIKEIMDVEPSENCTGRMETTKCQKY